MQIILAQMFLVQINLSKYSTKTVESIKMPQNYHTQKIRNMKQFFQNTNITNIYQSVFATFPFHVRQSLSDMRLDFDK